ATSTTSPPRPPSPPSGPPRGTYFSRRKLTQPSPPRPPATSTTASSMKVSVVFMARPSVCRIRSLGLAMGARPGGRAASGRRLDARGEAALRGTVVHRAVAQRVERIVAAAAHVAARMDVRADLADQDCAGAHLLAAV